MFLPFLILVVSITFEARAYVLLQVRKDNNQSNVDALIHKVVPAPTTNNAPKKDDQTVASGRKSHYDGAGEHILENLMLNIDTGSRNNQGSGAQTSDIVKFMEKAVLDYVKNNPSPGFRSGVPHIVKPEIVHFRSGNGKPSVVFDVNTRSVLDAMKDVLSSRTVAESMKLLTKKAAVVFRAFKDEMNKNQRDESW